MNLLKHHKFFRNWLSNRIYLGKGCKIHGRSWLVRCSNGHVSCGYCIDKSYSKS